MRLEQFDHPLVFIFAITLAVVATTKLIAYFSGKAGVSTLNQWILNK